MSKNKSKREYTAKCKNCDWELQVTTDKERVIKNIIEHEKSEPKHDCLLQFYR